MTKILGADMLPLIKQKLPTKTSQLTNDSGFITSSSLSNLVPNTRTVNGKALSSDITLSASDVGALRRDDFKTVDGQSILGEGDLVTKVQYQTFTSTVSAETTLGTTIGTAVDLLTITPLTSQSILQLVSTGFHIITQVSTTSVVRLYYIRSDSGSTINFTDIVIPTSAANKYFSTDLVINYTITANAPYNILVKLMNYSNNSTIAVRSGSDYGRLRTIF